MTEILLLVAVIEQLYKCQALHAETVFVDEIFLNVTVWKGDVEVFDLIGYPSSRRCYAWLTRKDGKLAQPVALLEKWPVVSPTTAVKTSITFDASMNPDRDSSLPLEE
jgi:hypothetical protein